MDFGDWGYAAEGGANLVVRYRGPTPSPFAGKILRLRKRKLDRTPIGVSPALELPVTLLTTLLGSDLLVESQKITLSTEFLAGLNKGMERDGVRPTDRATVDEVDPTCESGVLMPDLTHGNRILAIEIKVSTPSPRSSALLIIFHAAKVGLLAIVEATSPRINRNQVEALSILHAAEFATVDASRKLLSSGTV